MVFGRKIMKITTKTILLLIAFAWTGNTTAMEPTNGSPKSPSQRRVRRKYAEKLRKALNKNPFGRQASALFFQSNNATNFLARAQTRTSSTQQTELLAKAAASGQAGSQARLIAIQQLFEKTTENQAKIETKIEKLEMKIAHESVKEMTKKTKANLKKLHQDLAKKLIDWMVAPLAKDSSPWIFIYKFMKNQPENPYITKLLTTFNKNLKTFKKSLTPLRTTLRGHLIKVRAKQSSDYQPDIEKIKQLSTLYSQVNNDAAKLFMHAQLLINLKKPAQDTVVTKENPMLIQKLFTMLLKETDPKQPWTTLDNKIRLWEILSDHLSRETKDATLLHHAPKFAAKLKQFTDQYNIFYQQNGQSEAARSQAIKTIKELDPTMNLLVANIIPLYIEIAERDNADPGPEFNKHSKAAAGLSQAIELKFWLVEPETTD